LTILLLCLAAAIFILGIIFFLSLAVDIHLGWNHMSNTLAKHEIGAPCGKITA
jgi:hypothetical protein